MKKRVVNACKKGTCNDIKDTMHAAPPELTKVVEAMLDFNPFYRPKASQLLKNPIFEELLQMNPLPSVPKVETPS